MRFLGFFFGTGVSAESSRGLVLDSDVDSTSRAGVVGVVGGAFVASVVSLSCAGVSDRSLVSSSVLACRPCPRGVWFLTLTWVVLVGLV